jgi:hypothetical protein
MFAETIPEGWAAEAAAANTAKMIPAIGARKLTDGMKAS